MTKSMWFCYGRADRCSVQVQSGRGNQLHELQEQIALLVIMSVHALLFFRCSFFNCAHLSLFFLLCAKAHAYLRTGEGS